MPDKKSVLYNYMHTEPTEGWPLQKAEAVSYFEVSHIQENNKICLECGAVSGTEIEGFSL